MIEEILNYNKEFVATEGYKKFITSKYPDKRIAIVTCMVTRLTGWHDNQSFRLHHAIALGGRI